MANLFIGLTDYDWYDFLRTKGYEEVNFWRPGGTAFKALRPGELFLFKLKSPPSRTATCSSICSSTPSVTRSFSTTTYSRSKRTEAREPG